MDKIFKKSVNVFHIFAIYIVENDKNKNLNFKALSFPEQQ
jgi:hypothetical protein